MMYKELYEVLDAIRQEMNGLHEKTAMIKGRCTMGASVDQTHIDDALIALDHLKNANDYLGMHDLQGTGNDIIKE